MANETKIRDRYSSQETYSSEAYSLAKVFLYVFLGLTITSAICLGLAAIYRYIFNVDYENGVDVNLQMTAVIVLIITLIASFIGIIVLSFVVPITVHRGKRSVLAPAIIYTILMGIALSTIAIFIPWYILGATFLITSIIFALMALIALLSKERLNGLAIAAIGLFTGAGIISLFLWILMLSLDGVVS